MIIRDIHSFPTRRSSDLAIVFAAMPSIDNHGAERFAGIFCARLNRSRPGSTSSEEPRQNKKQKPVDRKSTRLNSSHITISYAVFCLKKKKIHKVLTIYLW